MVDDSRAARAAAPRTRDPRCRRRARRARASSRARGRHAQLHAGVKNPDRTEPVRRPADVGHTQSPTIAPRRGKRDACGRPGRRRRLLSTAPSRPSSKWTPPHGSGDLCDHDIDDGGAARARPRRPRAACSACAGRSRRPNTTASASLSVCLAAGAMWLYDEIRRARSRHVAQGGSAALSRPSSRILRARRQRPRPRSPHRLR